MAERVTRYLGLFLLLTSVLILTACGASSQATTDGDSDQPVIDGDNDEEASIDPELVRCYAFCERAFECDADGSFGENQRTACRDLCPQIDQTCVTPTMLDCAERSRCDAFISCVLETESSTDCLFPIDGDLDDSSEYRASIELPKSIDFGAVVLGQTAERKLTIGNNGRIVLEIYDVLVSDNLTEFSFVSLSDETLIVAPGDTIELSIRYAPQDAGRDSATVLVYSSDPAHRVSQVELTSDYKGYANIDVSSRILDFGTVPVGGESQPRPLRISNTPGSPTDNRLLTILDLSILNTSEGAFSFAPTSPKPPFYVIPGSSVDILLVLSPPTWGALEDTLVITSDSNTEADRVLQVALNGSGAARRLCVNPDPVQFGSVRVGSQAVREIELEACGTSAVTISGVSLSDEEAGFELVSPLDTGENGLTLEVGERESFMVRFTPTTTISRSVLLVIESDDLAFPLREVPVNAQGAVSNLSPSPQVLSFDNVGLNTTKDLTLSVRNIGTWPVEVNGVRFELQDSPFSVLDAESAFPFTLEAGQQEELTVRFFPDVEGSAFDNMTIESDNSTGDVSVGLSGRGTAATVQLSVGDALSFDNVQIGTHRDAVITIMNVGRAPLTLSDWGLSLGESVFSVTPSASQTVLPYNASVDVTVTFTPSATGTFQGLFYLDSNDTVATRQHVEIDLTGVAIDPVLKLSESFPYNFGQVFVGAQGGPLAVAITNDGVGPLTINAIAHNDLFTDGFILVVPNDNFPAVLRPDSTSDDTLNFIVIFSPSAASNYAGTIQIESNDPDRTPLTISVSGRGALCPVNFYNCDNDPSDCEYECHGSPGSLEQCNGEDDNCNCQTDEGFNTGDLCAGNGVCPNGVTECDAANPGQVICSTNPGGSDYTGTDERCNNLDDDCDGLTDEDFGVKVSCDGQGACGMGMVECKNAFSTRCSTERGGSEDQSDDEICDDQDNDCDGQTDEDFGVGALCNGEGLCADGIWECDGPQSIRCSSDPGGSEYPVPAPSEICDSQDNDCDGSTDEDWQIGLQCLAQGECPIGFWECDTASTRRCSTNPGGSEYPVPAPIELCDGRDNDCDGLTDEDYQIGQVCDGVGQCGIGLYECRSLYARHCSTDVGGSEYPDPTPVERCDGFDNDCDGLIDEDYALNVACDGVGECGQGVFECASIVSTRCSTDIGGSAFEGQDEICDNKDNDCDGSTDETFSIGTLCEGIGECGQGIRQCSPTNLQATICSSEPGGTNYNGSAETCDGLDNDCDGYVDNICRVNIYRYGQIIASGDDDYRLGTSQTPPAGYALDYAGPVFALYTSERPDTVALVQLTKQSVTDTVYITNPLEITSLESAGWQNDGVRGYVSTGEGADVSPLYRLVSEDLSAHFYTTNYDEYLQLISSGWDVEGIEGYAYNPKP
jgi:hypothetical protein